jgi:hypothetical protein
VKILLSLLVTLLLACSPAPQEQPPEDADLAPIGPGSDSSALIPPDTPESRQPPTPAKSPPRDTTR